MRPSLPPPSISRPISLLGCVPQVLADDPALVDHEDAVRERDDLVELQRDQQDRAARVALVDEPRGEGTRSRRRRRRAWAGRRSSTFGSRLISRAAIDLLLIAAREAAGARRRPAAADVELPDQVARALDQPLREEPTPDRVRRARRSRGARCSRRSRTRARARAAGGPPGCDRPRRRACAARSRGASRWPATRIEPLCTRTQAR